MVEWTDSDPHATADFGTAKERWDHRLTNHRAAVAHGALKADSSSTRRGGRIED